MVDQTAAVFGVIPAADDERQKFSLQYEGILSHLEALWQGSLEEIRNMRQCDIPAGEAPGEFLASFVREYARGADEASSASALISNWMVSLWLGRHRSHPRLWHKCVLDTMADTAGQCGTLQLLML